MVSLGLTAAAIRVLLGFSLVGAIFTERVFDVTAVIFLAIVLIVPLFLMAHERQDIAIVVAFFRRQRKKIRFSLWPQKLFWNEGLVDWFACWFFGVTAALIALPVFDALKCTSFCRQFETLSCSVYCREPTDGELALWFWLTLIFIAYFHQGRYLVLLNWEEKRKRKNKRVNKTVLPRAKRPVKTVEDTDHEFNDFRWKQRTGSPPPQKNDEEEELRRKLEE